MAKIKLFKGVRPVDINGDEVFMSLEKNDLFLFKLLATY